MSSRRKEAHTEDVSLETTVPTDLSFSPEEVSELYTTDDDRFHAERRVGRSYQVMKWCYSDRKLKFFIRILMNFRMHTLSFMSHSDGNINSCALSGIQL